MGAARNMLERAVAAFNTRDPGETIRFLGENMELRAPGGVTLDGRAFVNRWNRDWFAAFADASLEIVRTVEAEPVITLEATFRGTHTGPPRTPARDFGGDGNKVVGPFVGIYHVVDDQFASAHVFFDWVDILTQIGAMTSTKIEPAEKKPQSMSFPR